MAADDRSLLQFPADLPIKVFGRNDAAFRDTVLTVVRAHFAAEPRVSEQLSSGGKYVSLTITVHAESRAQADAVYHALVNANEVLMAL